MSITLLRRSVKTAGSEAELARRLGVPQQTVNYWMRRNRVPSWRIAALRSLGLDAPQK